MEEDHHLRSDTTSFQEAEFGVAPVAISSEEALRRGEEGVRWMKEHNAPRHNDPVQRYGIERVSSLFKRPYLKVMPTSIP